MVNLPKNEEENGFLFPATIKCQYPLSQWQEFMATGPLSWLGFCIVGAYAGPVHTVTISMSSSIHSSAMFVWKTQFVAVFNHLWLLQSFHPPFSQRSLSLEKTDVVYLPYFELITPQSEILCLSTSWDSLS